MDGCRVEGCKRPHWGRGLCKMHLQKVTNTMANLPTHCKVSECNSEVAGPGFDLCDRCYQKYRLHPYLVREAACVAKSPLDS